MLLFQLEVYISGMKYNHGVVKSEFRGGVSIGSWGAVGSEDFSLTAAVATVHIITIPA